MIPSAPGLLATIVIGVTAIACASGDGGGGGAATPSSAATNEATSVSATVPTTTKSTFLIYRDAAGDLLARDIAEGGKTYRQTVDFSNEVVVGATCTPDGLGIAYLKQEFDETEREIIVHGENALADPVFLPSTVQGIAWSPDGTQVAVTDYDGFAQVHKVSILDLASGEITELSSGPDFAGSIAWSPDGSRIAYYTQKIAGGETSIMTVTPEGGGKIELADRDIDWFDPDWSADSKSILVAGLVGERFQLYLLDAETGQSKQITDSDIFKRGAKFSPDGGTIGYTGSIVTPQVSLQPLSRSLHSFGIFLLDSDGTNERAFTADPRLNPGAAVDPYLDAYLLGWCAPGPWLDDLWVEEQPEATQ